jgi:hypothetical protein
MTYDKKLSNVRSTAAGVKARDPRQAHAPSGLSIADFPRKTGSEQGSDPYNTSGSFDRKKHWARIGKR